MSWSLRIGRIFGIDVYVHVTFFVLLAWIVLHYYSATHDIAVALREMLFVVIVFTIIVMHEYGHALAARAFGVETKDITLLPIGGVARLERIPENPYQEFVIAVAGPAVNVVLAMFVLAWLVASGQLASALSGELLDLMHGSFAVRLFKINVWLVVFNMIPAFPMDGGRVLRSVLAMGLTYVRATQIAAVIGQALALALGLYGLSVGAPLAVLVAFFVFMGAAQEAAAVMTRSSLAGVQVRQAMISDFRTVTPHDSLDAVAGHVLAGFQQDFPVMEDGQVVGVIARGDLVKALRDVGREGRVSDVMQREFVTVDPEEPLETALQKLQTCDCHSMPVLDDGRLVGLITAENVGEFLMLRSAVRERRET